MNTTVGPLGGGMQHQCVRFSDYTAAAAGYIFCLGINK